MSLGAPPRFPCMPPPYPSPASGGGIGTECAALSCFNHKRTRSSCAIHCSDQSETMACAYQRLSCAAAWVQASGTGVVADGGRPRHIGRAHIGRAVDPLLERAQALLEGSAGERPHVHLDDLGQFG